MTLTVKLDLSPEQETQLRDSIARHDIARVRQLLSDALEDTVESLLHDGLETPDESAFDTMTAQLVDMVAETITPETPILSDEAVSRTGIYEDHP